jgi:predicted TIM-barrel fold metal-dependent hydrolase
MRILDCHFRVVSPDRTRYPRHDLWGHQPPWIDELAVTTEQMLAEMDAAGVERGILVSSPIVYGYDASYTADSAAAHPGRFGSSCAIDVRAPDAVRQLRHWIVARKMNGLRIFTSGGPMPEDSDWFDDPVTFPVWETAVELGFPISVTMKPGGYSRLARMAKRFPSVRIVMDHLCHPPIDDGPPFHRAADFFTFSDLPNVYLKLTMQNFENWNALTGIPEPFIQRCVDLWGSGRMIWGSNYPEIVGPLSRIVEVSQRTLAFLPMRDREAIFGGTAAMLYPILSS